tara:strand:- start:47 stop:292 length:246 start_codon:yes stop_codon:yes gene_type:complete
MASAAHRAIVAAARTPYIDSWYYRTLKEKELTLPALEAKEEDADVCVVGAGLAGTIILVIKVNVPLLVSALLRIKKIGTVI